jgi:hypothetical protein
MSLSSRGNPLYPRFSIEEYQANPVAIKKVNDAALEYLEVLCGKIEKNEELLRKQDKKILEMQQIGIMDMAQPLFLLLASTLLAFGVNLATASPHDWLGWVLSFVGCAIQIIVIFISIWVKLRRGV